MAVKKAKKKSAKKKATARGVPHASLSFRRVLSAIDDTEARYRAFKPATHQRRDKQRALRLLADVKKKFRVLCLAAGRPGDQYNIAVSI